MKVISSLFFRIIISCIVASSIQAMDNGSVNLVSFLGEPVSASGGISLRDAIKLSGDDKPASKAKLKAAAQAMEKKSNDETCQYVFERIKENIERSPHRIKSWSNLMNLPRKIVTKGTNCFDSALYVISLINNGEEPGRDIWNPKENECTGLCIAFTNKDIQENQKNPIAQNFFDASDNQHLFFYIEIGSMFTGSGHGFVVEKMNNSINECYRVYQSWYKHFTLAQWLGIDPWPTTMGDDNETTKKKFDQFYTKYGCGKLLSLEEMRDFLLRVLYLEADMDALSSDDQERLSKGKLFLRFPTPYMHVKMFKVDS